MLSKVRKSARTLLTLDPKDPRRLFETPPLLRRLKRYGLLTDDENSLDDILKLTTQRFMERRLQTKVLKQGLAKSIHHARVLITAKVDQVVSPVKEPPRGQLPLVGEMMMSKRSSWSFICGTCMYHLTMDLRKCRLGRKWNAYWQYVYIYYMNIQYLEDVVAIDAHVFSTKHHTFISY